MPELTTEERALFSAGQLAQLDRLSPERRDEYLSPPDVEDPEALKAKVLKRFVSYSPGQLRARVNIASVTWGRNPIINWAPDNDYTIQEMEAIQEGLRVGDKFVYRVAEIIAEGPSLKQRVQTLEQR